MSGSHPPVTNAPGTAAPLAPSLRRFGAWAPAIVVVALFHIVWEGHGVADPAFRNPDVAGIAYNARLLASGGLPYLDSAEIKPPGAFLLFAPFLAVGGMRLVWAVATLWGAALSLATGALAAACFGRRAGPHAAVLHASWAVLGTDGDINYSFWMALPFTLAAACACAAVTSESVRRRRVAWTFAGALALFAVSIKPSAWTLLVVFGVLVGRELAQGRITSALDAIGAGVAGAALCAALIALPYALRGELKTLALGLSTVSAFGSEYVAVIRGAYGGRFAAVLAGMHHGIAHEIDRWFLVFAVRPVPPPAAQSQAAEQGFPLCGRCGFKDVVIIGNNCGQRASLVAVCRLRMVRVDCVGCMWPGRMVEIQGRRLHKHTLGC